VTQMLGGRDQQLNEDMSEGGLDIGQPSMSKY
jgi:hypothetical protein